MFLASRLTAAPPPPYGLPFVQSVSLRSAVGLDFLIGFALGLGRGHEDAFQAEFAQAACEDEAGWPGLVADLQFLEGDAELLREFAQGVFGTEVAAAAGSVVDGFPAGTLSGVGDGD